VLIIPSIQRKVDFLGLFLKTNLLFVLDFSPGQLTVGKFHQHVEQGPQVVMAA
jgi:hypothetical protein